MHSVSDNDQNISITATVPELVEMSPEQKQQIAKQNGGSNEIGGEEANVYNLGVNGDGVERMEMGGSQEDICPKGEEFVKCKGVKCYIHGCNIEKWWCCRKKRG